MSDSAQAPLEAPPTTEPTAPRPLEGAVLAVFAHPDDAEIAAGGTLARMAAHGREVHLLVLTNGDRGSQDPACDCAALARVRREEQAAAAAVLGLKGWRILDIRDGELENTAEVRAEVVRTMREVCPDTVVTCDPAAMIIGNRRAYYNHPDHRAAAAIALDCAAYGAGNPHYFPEQLVGDLRPWDPPEALLAWTNVVNHHEDITGFVDAKVAALAEHRSQVAHGDFHSWLPKVAARAGEVAGCGHAEAFRRLRLRG